MLKLALYLVTPSFACSYHIYLSSFRASKGSSPQLGDPLSNSALWWLVIQKFGGEQYFEKYLIPVAIANCFLKEYSGISIVTKV